jgi:predicted PurR-regulated permease PerM
MEERCHVPLTYADLKRWLRLLVLLILAACLAWVLQPILLLFAIVILLAMVLNPIIASLERKGIKRGLAVLLLAVSFVGVLALVFWLLLPPLLEQLNELIRRTPEYWNRLQTQAETYSQRYPYIQNALPDAEKVVNTFGARIGEVLQLLVQSTFHIVGGLFGAIFAALLLVFILINPEPLVTFYLKLIPDRHRDAARRALLRLTLQMAAWARGVVINGTITGLSMGLFLAWIGVQPALVFAVIAFLGEFVPMVGPVVASVPALFVALSMGVDKFGLALLVVLFVHQVETNLLIPFVFGRAMDLNPVSILFFTLAMSSLFGLTGAVLAVPAAAMFKIAIEEFYLDQCQLNEDQIAAQAKQIIYGRADPETR